MAAHATLSPSSAARWLHCPGSVALSRDIPDTAGAHAEEGSAAHALAEECLNSGRKASELIGTNINFAPGKMWFVDDDMAEHVQKYVDYVRSIEGELHVEYRLDIEPITGEAAAHGTSDAVIITTSGELVIVDLKYGRGVKVDADRNEQLAIYAAAAVEEFSLLYDINTVRMVIVQPRLGHISEWTIPVVGQFDGETPSLNGFRQAIAAPAARALHLAHEPIDMKPELDLHPKEKSCQWCRAKAVCPALATKVQDTVGADFDTLTATQAAPSVAVDNEANLSAKMQAVDLIEDWCKAVRAEVERRLFAGQPVEGFKLVEGRRGARAWVDADEVEKTLKSMRLKVEEMYDLKLISPTSAEKLSKSGVIGPRQWPRLLSLITQPNGKPSVAPESDKRPAVSAAPSADEFDDHSADDLV